MKRGIHRGGTENLWCNAPPPEEHHKAIDNLNTTVQVINTQSYEMEGLVQANAVLNIFK